MELNRISPGLFTDSEGTLFTRTGKFSDGTPMEDSKVDGIDFIKVGFEYFKRASGDPIDSAPSIDDDVFEI